MSPSARIPSKNPSQRRGSAVREVLPRKPSRYTFATGCAAAPDRATTRSNALTAKPERNVRRSITESPRRQSRLQPYYAPGEVPPLRRPSGRPTNINQRLIWSTRHNDCTWPVPSLPSMAAVLDKSDITRQVKSSFSTANSSGVRLPSELCGRSVLYSMRHASMTLRPCARLRTSARSGIRHGTCR